jgi:polar amino acid transport system ATP-binding protein
MTVLDEPSKSTTHVEFAKSIAKRIIFLNDGLILEDSEVEAFFNKPKSHRARIFLENTKY